MPCVGLNAENHISQFFNQKVESITSKFNQMAPKLVTNVASEIKKKKKTKFGAMESM